MLSPCDLPASPVLGSAGSRPLMKSLLISNMSGSVEEMGNAGESKG